MSLAAALGLHGMLIVALVVLTPWRAPAPDATAIEVALVEPAATNAEPAPRAEPDDAGGPTPAVPPMASHDPPPAAPPAPDEPAPTPPASPAPQPLGLAIRPDADPAADVPAVPARQPPPDILAPVPASPPAQTAPAPAARLEPLVIAANAPHDPRLPAYPADARARRQQGEVLVELELDPAGAIRAARVKKSSGHASLDTAALRSARALRFRPPRPPPGVVLRHTIVVEIPFSFRLQ